jgi:PAS domain S-box-containing protein
MPECPSNPRKSDYEVECDTQGKITRISPELACHLGYDAADLIGRNLFILFPPRAVTAFLDAFSLAYLTGVFKGELEMVRADGSAFAAQLHLAHSKNATGKTTHLLCTVQAPTVLAAI